MRQDAENMGPAIIQKFHINRFAAIVLLGRRKARARQAVLQR